MNVPTDFQNLIKLLIIGDSSVGKSNFLFQFIENKFTDTHIATIGFDFKSQKVTLPNSKQVVKLQIWDTAGQDRFRTITKTYYKGSHGVILVYDVCDERSFGNVKNWVNQIEQNAKSSICKVLVGNKCDKAERVITEEQGRKLAEEYNMKFYETSAKTGQNVEEAFTYLTREILKIYKNKEGHTGGVTLNGKDDKEHQGCCK